MNKLNSNAGFTLVEVLVAVSILGLGLTASATLLNQNINSARVVRDSYIAGGLAQEGIELVRNFRDNEWHAGVSFGSLIPDGTWSVEWNSTTLGASYNTFLKKTVNGFYNYAAGADTLFKRQITITTVVANVEKKVLVIITWNKNGNPKTFSAEAHLFNWGP